MNDSQCALERRMMVAATLVGRGIADQRVLQAMSTVPRHVFVPEALEKFAYHDGPLSIGEGQTISQPYVVALMCEALRVKPSDRILEVGAGSGYAAAILSLLGAEVHAVERHQQLAMSARGTLEAGGYDNVHVHWSDGQEGWESGAPYDAILVSAAADRVPPQVLSQLALGGRLVMPVGDHFSQQLLRITRAPHGLERESLISVRFVPLLSGRDEDRATHVQPAA